MVGCWSPKSDFSLFMNIIAHPAKARPTKATAMNRVTNLLFAPLVMFVRIPVLGRFWPSADLTPAIRCTRTTRSLNE